MMNDFVSQLVTNWIGTTLRAMAVGWAGMLIKQGYIGSDQATTFEGVIVGGAMLAWSFYTHYGRAKLQVMAKNIPSAMTGTRVLAPIALMFLFAAHDARAADVLTKAPPATTTQCTIIQCTGFYAGGGFAGNGTNADILGSGLSGSVFGAGAIPFLDAGWQYWNNKLFFAVEIGIGDQLNMGGLSINNENGIFAYQEMQVGGSLYGLFNAGTAPITVPQTLTPDLIAPYLSMGIVERPFGNGWSTGAGAKFTIAPNTFLDIGYRYINYGSATVGQGNGVAAQFNAENLVRLSVNYKF